MVHSRLGLALGVALLAVAGGRAHAAPVNSDLAAHQNGGGCYPVSLTPALLDMLALVDPEWAPVVNGTVVDSTPIAVHGVVQEMHGDLSGDFPATHLRADVNHFVLLDPPDADRLATGNDDGLIHFEWEAGVYPAWAWAGAGDRIVGLGRWIFDCGHPGPIPGACSVTTDQPCAIDGDCASPACDHCTTGESCIGAHYAYSSELHPPQATAAIREGRGAILSAHGTRAVPATRADVYVSDQGGGAGDRCILSHRASPIALLSVQCFPLAHPVAPMNAQDFEFDIPLPPKVAGAHGPRWRVVAYSTPGGIPARLRIKRILADPSPHLHATVQMTRPVHGMMPTGFAGTVFAGWRSDLTPLTHVRLTVNAVAINNALQPATPLAPRTCQTSNNPCDTDADCDTGSNEPCFGEGPVKSWHMEAAVNGEWQEFPGLDVVSTNDVIPQAIVYDQYLRATDVVHFQVDARSHECINTMYAKSLGDELGRLGFDKGTQCLNSEARNPGDIDVTYAGPDFGASAGGSTDYDVASSGGVGGHCSTNTGLQCTVDADCPSGETCVTTGGAYNLHYRIERLS